MHFRYFQEYGFAASCESLLVSMHKAMNNEMLCRNPLGAAMTVDHPKKFFFNHFVDSIEELIVFNSAEIVGNSGSFYSRRKEGKGRTKTKLSSN
jgi:hypothetical protein